MDNFIPPLLSNFRPPVTTLAYNESTRLDPNHADAWCNKGDALGSMGNYYESVKAYDESIKLDPKNAMVWLKKGNAHGAAS